jgi:hypothetical protein
MITDLTTSKMEAVHVEDKKVVLGLADPTDVEILQHEHLKGEDGSNLKLDKRGLPLVPQPTSHKDDPLVSHKFVFHHQLRF